MASRMQIYIHLDTGTNFPTTNPTSSESARNDSSSNIENIGGATSTPKIEEELFEENRTDAHHRIPVPHLQHIDRKHTLLLNCAELSEQLNRTPRQITDFLVYTIGTNGKFVDDQGNFAVKGRFQQRQIERALEQFVDQYIVCHSCNTWSTVLEDSDDKRRLLLLRCVECDHSRKVPEIKAYKGCRGLKVGRVKPNDKKD